jgi:hypothetical protein
LFVASTTSLRRPEFARINEICSEHQNHGHTRHRAGDHPAPLPPVRCLSKRRSPSFAAFLPISSAKPIAIRK